MPKPQKPTNVFVTNGWYMELPGLVSPQFESLSGLSKKTGTVEVVDAGTNVKYKFSSQIVDFGTITLVRPYDGSSDDVLMRALVNASITEGIKYAGVLVKRHFGNEVYRIAFEGLMFTEETYPDFNTGAEEKQNISYVANVDSWILI